LPGLPLFEAQTHQTARQVPLAEALRPKTLDDYLGQAHVVGQATPLRNLIQNHRLTSLIFWGPPGVGKTTLARIIAQASGANFTELSAVSSGIKELRDAVSQAHEAKTLYGQASVVFIDEIHRYSKTQQDALLPYVENGTVTLMGATTENPSFQVISALLSRVLVVQLTGLGRTEMMHLITRGIAYWQQHQGDLVVDEAAQDFLVNYANGDGRSALNLLETAAACAPQLNNTKHLTVDLLEQLAQQGRLNYDRDGDAHYDHASAFQKSLRGSDANAAIFWLAKMIAAGEDPRFIARRLVITASEDVGNADPMALLLAMAAAESVERLGLPEARIPLAQAVIYVAQAPKSNQAICAIDAALADLSRHGKSLPVPQHLRDSHYSDAKTRYGHGVGYHYSHDATPEQNAQQRFLPDDLPDVVLRQPHLTVPFSVYDVFAPVSANRAVFNAFTLCAQPTDPTHYFGLRIAQTARTVGQPTGLRRRSFYGAGRRV
jgi:putative ATPase